MKISIGTLLIFFCLIGLNSETYFGLMAETKDVYRGPTDIEFITELKRQFSAEIEVFRNSDLRRAAYRELFGVDPDVPIKPSCDLAKKFRDQSPTLFIDYEAHGEKNAAVEKKKLLEKANRGEVVVLIESDMAVVKKSDSFDKKTIEAGIVRTMKTLGVKSEPNFQFTHGIDDSRVRAFAIEPDLPDPFSQSQIDTRTTEIFRNPVLRKTLRGMPVKNELKAARLGIFSKLDRLDIDPGIELSELKEETSDYFLARAMYRDLVGQFPATASLASKYSLGLFEIRDESMSRAILDRLCDQPNPLKEVHVVIGALHIDGIKKRIGKLLENAGFKVEERNLMERPKVKEILEGLGVR